MSSTSPNRPDWEAQQKHASFFQTQLQSTQAAASAAVTNSTILLSLGGIMAKFSGVAPRQDWLVLYIAAFAWCFMTGFLTFGFAKSAQRIRTAYLAEHGSLFPGTAPYRLESYLLDVVDRLPRFLRKRLDGELAAEDQHPPAIVALAA